jgi:precorrin-2 dehydrogenase/sirohydrochlorin ferrochelatase
MALLPLFVEVGGRPVLVVGGGEVATRKVQGLCKAGASVTVISPQLTAKLQELVRQGTVRHVKRRYQPGDMAGFFLIYAATGDGALEHKLFAEARDLGVMINVAGQPQLCSFIVPAVIRRRGLLAAISTAGASPALARRLRQQLDMVLGAQYEALVDLMGRVRLRLRNTVGNARARSSRLNALANSELAECLLRRDLKGADRLLAEHLGEEYSLAALGCGARWLEELFGRRTGAVERPTQEESGAAGERK